MTFQKKKYDKNSIAWMIYRLEIEARLWIETTSIFIDFETGTSKIMLIFKGLPSIRGRFPSAGACKWFQNLCLVAA